MKQATFGTFQVGMLDNPSVEDKGGFEFAAGMDIFSEPGVLKAANAMSALPLASGLSLDALPTHLTRPPLQFGGSLFIAMGAKILKQENPQTQDLSLYVTNSQGVNNGLASWGNYLVYTSANKLGRVLHTEVGTSQNDTYASLSNTVYGRRAMIVQAGKLQIANYRYIDSLDESFALKAQAMKLPDATEATTLAHYFSDLFIGSFSPYSASLSIRTNDATIYRWNGISFSSGSALPGSIYPSRRFGTFALIAAAGGLYALVDDDYTILAFDGAQFVAFRRLGSSFISTLRPCNETVSEYQSGFLFTGKTTLAPGVFRFENGAICQSFVPSGVTPGAAVDVDMGFVKTGHQGKVYIGYKKTIGGVTSYHLEAESTNKQNNAFVATAWHRLKTDKLKRWGGVKLNLKPLPANTAVDVSYRTNRDAAFAPTNITITAANQDKPLLFKVQPRSRELQLQFKYTTSGANSPELLTYDLLYEILNSNR